MSSVAVGCSGQLVVAGGAAVEAWASEQVAAVPVPVVLVARHGQLGAIAAPAAALAAGRAGPAVAGEPVSSAILWTRALLQTGQFSFAPRPFP